MTSGRHRLIFLVAAGLAGGLAVQPAGGCLPPPPGWVPPTDEERVRNAVRQSTDIVYGVVVRGSDGNRYARFRVLHAYKGPLRPGTVLRARPGWGLDPPMCAGMLGSPPPVERGDAGVIAFRSDQPELNFVNERELELMFGEGLIRRARTPADPPTAPH